MIYKHDRELLPVCPVCNKKAKGRKLTLITHELSTGKQEVSLCENCFFRVPDGLHRQLISNSQSYGGEQFNTMVIKALRNTSAASDLNKGLVVLLNDDRLRFEKYRTKEDLCNSPTGSAVHAFENGKIISEVKDLQKLLDALSHL
jgi:hypothetical protein